MGSPCQYLVGSLRRRGSRGRGFEGLPSFAGAMLSTQFVVQGHTDKQDFVVTRSGEVTWGSFATFCLQTS